jgi:signal transduction histidine kinase
MTRSLRWRLTLSLAIVVLVVVVSVFLSLRLILHDILSTNVDENLTAQTGQVRAQIALSEEAEEGGLDREFVTGLAQTSSFPIVVRGTDGELIAQSAGAPVAELALSPNELAAVLEGRVMEQNVDVLGEAHTVRTSRLSIGVQVVGVVQVGESVEALNDVDSAVETTALIAGAVGIALALLTGFWIAESNLRPIARVTKVAREIEASDLSRRIAAVRQPVEVQRLADTFDAMLERLQRAFEIQRNFVLDMSHEVRTPLTALRGNLDVLLLEPDLDEELRTTLLRMKGEVDRLIRLSTNLLFLAHADAGREVGRAPVELDTLCGEVYQQMRYLRSDVTFALQRHEPVTVVGDRDLLKQTLINLADNALKYTPAGGRVSLSVFPQDGHAVVQVADTGVGIPPDQLAKIFERLERGEGGSRAVSGAGIGLSISEWIVKAHGGEIKVESRPGEGSTFTVLLPLDGAGG